MQAPDADRVTKLCLYGLYFFIAIFIVLILTLY